MRVFSCNHYCPSTCFSKSSFCRSSPYPLKLEDIQQQNVSSPSPVSHGLEEKSSSEEKVEVGKADEACQVKVEIFRKSSLKRPAAVSEPKELEKGRVKWMDFVGKDLVEIREFEPTDSGESDDDDGGHQSCICVIQ